MFVLFLIPALESTRELMLTGREDGQWRVGRHGIGRDSPGAPPPAGIEPPRGKPVQLCPVAFLPSPVYSS